jgi:hypothetical protein
VVDVRLLEQRHAGESRLARCCRTRGRSASSIYIIFTPNLLAGDENVNDTTVLEFQQF